MKSGSSSDEAYTRDPGASPNDLSTEDQPPKANDRPGVNLTALLTLLVTAGLTLAAIVPWGDFTDHTHWDEVGWIPFVSQPWRVRDVILNLLLCAPLGVASALTFRYGLLAAGATSLTISLVGEWLQVYSHGRFPSATDLVCNVCGALAAALVVRYVQRRPSP